MHLRYPTNASSRMPLDNLYNPRSCNGSQMRTQLKSILQQYFESIFQRHPSSVWVKQATFSEQIIFPPMSFRYLFRRNNENKVEYKMHSSQMYKLVNIWKITNNFLFCITEILAFFQTLLKALIIMFKYDNTTKNYRIHHINYINFKTIYFANYFKLHLKFKIKSK